MNPQHSFSDAPNATTPSERTAKQRRQDHQGKRKDLLHVKKLLGHKDLRTTLRYTQLLDTLENDQYHCKTATNTEEAKALIEVGFEYIIEKDGIMLFRKRK